MHMYIIIAVNWSSAVIKTVTTPGKAICVCLYVQAVTVLHLRFGCLADHVCIINDFIVLWLSILCWLLVKIISQSL